MPKPVKKATKPTRRSSDPNLRVHQMMAEHMAKADTTPETLPAPAPSFKEQLSAHMAKLGSRGGKVSGARRLTNLSTAQRKKIAQKAAAARWAKTRKK